MRQPGFLKWMPLALVLGATLSFSTLEAQSCGAPDVSDISRFLVTNRTIQISVLVHVNPLSPKDSVQLRYKKSSDPDWIPLEKIRTAPMIGFNNHEYWTIDAEIGPTNYQFQARVHCNFWNQWSPWSATKTMSASCTADDYSFVNNQFTYNQWPDRLRFGVGEWCCSDLYEGRLSLDDGNTFTEVVQNSQPQLEFGGLAENREYPFKFRLQCSDGSFSGFSDVVRGVTTCTTPVYQSNYTIRPLSESSIEVSCTKPADQFQFRLRERNQTTWTTSPEKTQNRHTFSQLELGKKYEVQCRVRCGGPLEIWTDWSATTVYEIPFSCPVPGVNALGAKNIDHFAATLECTSNQHQDGLVQEHVFRYKRRDETTWTQERTDNNQLRIQELLADTRYQFQVKHNCISNVDGTLWSDTAAFRTTFYDCGVRDSSINFRNIGYTQADLVCKADGKYGYWWRYREVGRSQWTESGLVETSNRWTALGLKAGTDYEVQLRIWCNGNYSDYTGSRFFTTNTCLDPVATYMSAQELTNHTAVFVYAGDIQNGLEWQYRKLGNTNWLKVESNQQETPVESLMEAAEYEFRVRILCQIGDEVWSAWSPIDHFFTPCDVVINRISHITTTSVRIHCSSGGATGYLCQYRRSDGTSAWRTTGIVSASEFDITGLAPDTEYEFQVKGICAGESGLWSASTYAATIAAREAGCFEPRISELSANPVGVATAQLNCAIGGVSAYQFRYAANGMPNWTVTPESAQDFAWLSTLFPNTVYHFQGRVRCNTTDWSPWSDSIRFQTLVAPPVYYSNRCFTPSVSTLFATDIQSGSAALNCLVGTAEKYQFRIKPTSGSQWVTLPEQTTGSYRVSNLMENTSYDFQCRVFCNGDYGLYSGTRTFRTPNAQVCDEPYGLEYLVFPVGQTEATLRCLKDAKRYEFRYKEQNASFWITLPAGPDSTVQLDNLLPDQVYIFQVRILCPNNLISPFSNARFFRTLPDCTPASPSSLTTQSVGAHSATLVCGDDATAYQFRYRRMGATAWSYTRPADTTRVLLDSLLAQTTYEYQVLLICSESNVSTWSPSAQFTTTVTTSINERSTPFPWSIYPNPVVNDLHVQIDPSLEGCFYEITDLMGRRVSTGTLSDSPVVLRNLRLLPGMYAIRIRKDGRTDTRKFVVQ
jgi:hypothetical protein